MGLNIQTRDPISSQTLVSPTGTVNSNVAPEAPESGGLGGSRRADELLALGLCLPYPPRILALPGGLSGDHVCRAVDPVRPDYRCGATKAGPGTAIRVAAGHSNALT